MQKSISIYTYNSHLKYLSDYYDYKKIQSNKFTYRSFSSAADIQSPNLLKLVIDNKKNLTIANIHRFAKALDLTLDEIYYFEALVLYGQSSSVDERAYYRNRMHNARQEVQKNVVLSQKSEIYDHWYYPALLVTLDGRHFDKVSEISEKMLPLTSEEVSQGIEAFLRIGLLAENSGTYFINSQFTHVKDAASRNIYQKENLQKQLEISKQHLKNSYDKRAKFLSFALTISSENFDHYCRKLYSLCDSFISETNNEVPHEVFQFNLQFFSLAKPQD